MIDLSIIGMMAARNIYREFGVSCYSRPILHAQDRAAPEGKRRQKSRLVTGKVYRESQTPGL
jgi:hypothetical protein